MTFGVKRARVHLGRLTLLALIAAIVVAGLGAIDAISQRMLAAGAARMLASAEPSARSLLVTAQEAADPAVQDTSVREALREALPGAGALLSRQISAEVEVARGAEAGTHKADPFSVRLLDDERAPKLAALSTGAWPGQPGQVALPEAAAKRQGLMIGDTLKLVREDGELTLVGTWTASDAEDPAWHGDPAVASGSSSGTIGPAVVASGTLTELPARRLVTWEITPDSSVSGAETLASVSLWQRGIAKLADLPDAIDRQRQHHTQISGGLGETLQRQAAALAATNGLLAAPQLIVTLLGCLGFGSLLVSLLAARSEEHALLRARGASARRLALAAAGETGCFAAAGALLALMVLALTTGVTPLAWLAAIAVLAFASLAALLLTARAAVVTGAVRVETQRSDAGMRSFSAMLMPAGVAVALAALSSWQLFSKGSIVRDDGSADPLAVAAPALLLVAACSLTPVAAAPLAALAERSLRRSRGISPILPMRQIARRIGGSAVAILCLALAAASLAIAVIAPVIASGVEDRARSAQLGADVRVIADDGLGVAADLAHDLPSATRADEVLRTPLTVGAETVVLLAGPPAALGLPAEAVATSTSTRTEANKGSLAATITRSLATSFGIGEGSAFTARLRSVAHPVSIEVAGVVESIAGLGAGPGLAVSADALEATGAKLAANELWVRSDAPARVATQLRANATHPVRILTAAQVSAEPVTSVAPVILTAGSAVAAVLGTIGFFAAASATVRARREAPFVLRALGLARPRLRALRLSERAWLASYAVLTGAILGAIIAATVLPTVLAAHAASGVVG